MWIQQIQKQDTYSPVIKKLTVRTILALVARNNWKMQQLNVKNAFI